MPQEPHVILASSSPRRRELLKLAGIPFTVRTGQVDEDYPPSLPPEEVPGFLAKKKALAAAVPGDASELILAADTIVVVAGQILGKPGDPERAKACLRLLSGRCHQVITGVCLLRGTRVETFSERTDVFFKPLSGEDIAYYVDTYHPMDKAGAYAIQEWIGLRGVEKISGDYFNVVGLPVGRLVEHLRKFSV